MIFVASSAFANRSSAFGGSDLRRRSRNSVLILDYASSVSSLPGQLTSKLEPLSDQIQFSLRSRASRSCLLLESIKHVNRFPKTVPRTRTIRPTWIACANLPDGFGKAVQHPRAFMLLPNVRLVQRESELLSNQGVNLISSRESASQTNLRGCSGFSHTKVLHAKTGIKRRSDMSKTRACTLFLSRRRSRVRAPSSPPFL